MIFAVSAPSLLTKWIHSSLIIIVMSCCRRSGLRIGNIYGPGSDPIWLSDVYCGSGAENALEDCDHNGWGDTSSCDHDHDVTITCATNFTNTIGMLRQS